MSVFPTVRFPAGAAGGLDRDRHAAGRGLCRQPDSRAPSRRPTRATRATWSERVARRVTPAIARLQQAFHASGMPVYFTVFGSVAGTARDIRDLHHSLSRRAAARQNRGIGDSAAHRSGHRRDSRADGRRLDDTVVTKTSMDSFVSTQLPAMLRQRGIETVIVTGVLHRRLRREHGAQRRRAGLPRVRRRGWLLRMGDGLPRQEPGQPGALFRACRIIQRDCEHPSGRCPRAYLIFSRRERTIWVRLRPGLG